MAARLVVYFPLADPAASLSRLDLYVDHGVDVVECGWPSRDPHLDGPDVRASMARAIGGDPAHALREVRERLGGRAATLVMTYGEPEPADIAGVDAVLVVRRSGDPRRVALEAAAPAAAAFLPLPLTPEDIEAARHVQFYAMLQAAAGVTGPRTWLDPGNGERLRRLRDEGVGAPILLGFGISNGEQAKAAMAFGAEGIVVGSAALRAALQGERELAALLKDLRRGLDG